MDSTIMYDLLQRIIGWWSPPASPTSVIIAETAVLVPTKCLPTVIFSTIPPALSPISAELDLYNLALAVCWALSFYCYILWMRQHVTALYNRLNLITIIGLLYLVCFVIDKLYSGPGLGGSPFQHGTILSTIRNDWAHTWPEGITAKSNWNRCCHDLSTLFFQSLPHQMKESLWDEICATTSLVKVLVVSMKSRGFLIADLPFIAALLCFYTALMYSFYLISYIVPANPSPARSRISQQDIEMARLPPSLMTHISKYKLFMRRASHNRSRRDNELRQDVQESDTSVEKLKAASDDLTQKNEILRKRNEELQQWNAEALEANSKVLNVNVVLTATLEEFEEDCRKVCELNTALFDTNNDLKTLIQQLIAMTPELQALSDTLGIGNGSGPSSAPSEVAGPHSGTGAEAGTSTGQAKASVDGDSKANDGKPASPVDRPQDPGKEEGDAPPSKGEESAPGKEEGDAPPSEEEGHAGPSTAPPPDTNAGRASDALPDGESVTGSVEDSTTGGEQAAKKRRRKKRGGQHVRAAKEAAWARANAEAAKGGDEGETTETNEGDAE